MDKRKSDQLGLDLIELMKEALKDSERWFPNTAHDLAYYSIALGGETGEFQNEVKKLLRGDASIHDASARMRLMNEWTDIWVYHLLIGAMLQINPMQAYNYVRGENEKRFGGKNGNA